MNRIDQLKLKSLFKQLDYLLSEIEWKEEYVKEADAKFMEVIHNSTEYINESYNRVDKTVPIKIKEEKPKKKHDKKIKKLYREIVKKTHPDKTNDVMLSEIYIKVNDIYEEDDVFGIYRICNQLGLEFEMDSDELIKLEMEIKKLESRISFLENSYSIKWFEGNDEYKEKLVDAFIKKDLV